MNPTITIGQQPAPLIQTVGSTRKGLQTALQKKLVVSKNTKLPTAYSNIILEQTGEQTLNATASSLLNMTSSASKVLSKIKTKPSQ